MGACMGGWIDGGVYMDAWIDVDVWVKLSTSFCLVEGMQGES